MTAVIRKVCTKCGANRALKFYRGTRGHVCGFCRKRRTTTASRETRLMETYGLSLADYDALLDAQWGKCYICEKAYRYNLDVDHDHAQQKNLIAHGWTLVASTRASIRGLLCKRCNRRMLPAASDNPEMLERAAMYLRLSPAQSVLASSHRDNESDDRLAA